MINIETIQNEILDLEKRDTSYATIERLAWLYIVKDHLEPVASVKTIDARTGNRFLEACSNVPINSLLDVMSEHMTIIEALYPKEYELIIEKLKSAK